MLKPEPTYEVKNGEEFEKFLLGAIRDVRTKALDVDSARAISLLADKLNRYHVNQIVHDAQKGIKRVIPFFERNSNLLPMLTKP